jgi:ADP-heptose:LPS heptosyltransferase
MHIIKLEASLEIAGQVCEAGAEYVVHNGFVGGIMSCPSLTKCPDGTMKPIYRTVTVRPLEERLIDSSQDYNGRTIWMLRAGGFGDLLMLTPTIREIKSRWPQARVCVACEKSCADALSGADVEIHHAPLAFQQIGEDDALICYEGVIEDNPEARVTHGVDLFYKRSGLDGLPKSRRLDFRLTTFGDLLLPEMTGRPRVAVQAMASAKTRSLHPDMMADTLRLLVANGYDVFVLGIKGQAVLGIEGVHYLNEKGLTFRQSCTALAACHAAVVPDSSLFHVAQAIGVPTVALFGAFPASLRITNPSTTITLSGEGRCAPCFHHATGPKTQFPAGMACEIADFCTVMNQITPQEIARAVSTLVS